MPQDEALIVDEGTLLQPPPAPRPPPTGLEAAPPAGRLTCAQLSSLAGALAVAAPGGFISIPAATELLLKMLGEGVLPAVWDASPDAMNRALQQLDPVYSQYVSSAELVCGLIAAAFPEVLTVTTRQLVHGVELLAAADGDGDGKLTEDEWAAVGWWFGQPVAPPEPPAEPAPGAPFDRVAAVRHIIWQLFAAPPAEGAAPLMDYTAVMLHFCADRNLFAGIQKAVCLLARDPSPAARVTAEQVFRMAYPTGPDAGADINRSPFDLERVAAAVAAAAPGGGPSLTAEELMYSAACERLVRSLLDKYAWR